MRILCVLPSVPSPVKVRAYNLLPRLARRNEIHLVCVSSVEPSPEQREWMGRYCAKAVHVMHGALKGMVQCAVALPTRMPMRMAYCRSKTAKEAVRRVYEEQRPDVVYVERWRVLEFMPEELKAPLVCDPTDSMTLYNRRLMKAGTWWERMLGWEEYVKFLRYEGELARRADVCVFCSRVDMECVKEQAPEVQCELVPNGVDCGGYFFKDESEEEADTIVFTGAFNYRPNCHAVGFFMEKIFPRIRKEVPEAKFVAVGNGAGKELAGYRGRAGFEAVDFVADLRPYLAKATVAVAPLTVGSGVSNKVLEAFATGTPMVATPMPCGDLPVKSGEELLIGRNAGEFAEHAVRLLRDAGLRRQIAVRARRLAEEKYDWEIVSRKMEDVIQELAGMGANERRGRAFATAYTIPSRA